MIRNPITVTPSVFNNCVFMIGSCYLIKLLYTCIAFKRLYLSYRANRNLSDNQKEGETS